MTSPEKEKTCSPYSSAETLQMEIEKPNKFQDNSSPEKEKTCSPDSSAETLQMEVEKPNAFLPDELVESIIAMMPFPSIYKARTLSREWLARFSSVASQEDEGKKHLATRFQKLVGQWSYRWGTFCPVSIGRKRFSSYGYDHKSRSCLKLPSLSFLPESWYPDCLHIEGALLLLRVIADIASLCVANILTRSWKFLPPRPNSRHYVTQGIIVSRASLQMFKIIVFYAEEMNREAHLAQMSDSELDAWRVSRQEYFAQIYDSESDAWSTKKLIVSQYEYGRISKPVYLNGVIYIILDYNILIALNIEDGTWKEMDILDELELGQEANDAIDVVVFSGSELMIVNRHSEPHLTYQILKVDLGLQRLEEVGRGPPTDLTLSIHWPRLASLAPFIFFGRQDSGDRKVLAYNVNEDAWDSFDCSGIFTHHTYYYEVCSFRPGLNPFVEV